MMVYNGVPLKAHQFATDNVQLSGNSLRNAARQLFGFLQEKNGRVEKGREWSKGGKLELTLVKANTRLIA